jgi:hypothetical protein
MINCAHCKEQLSTYLDGIMTAEEKKIVEEHLSTCEQCKAAFSELKKTRETLRSLEEVEPPPWFTQKIMNRVREEAEPKKGLLQRLFFPLHIKIPVEALATCLVVVLALFVYKNTEPEIKALHEPEKIATVSPQDQAQKQYERAPSAPAPKELHGKSDGMLKENNEQRRNAISAAVSDSTGAGGLKKDAPSPAGIPEQQMAEKSLGEMENRYEAKTSEIESLKKQETMPKQKATAVPLVKLKEESIPPSVGSAQVKGTQEGREMQARSVIVPKQILFTVLTTNIETTAKETENLLNRFGAKNITKTSRQPNSVVFGAMLPGQKITEFFDALKTAGDVKGKDIPSKPLENYLAVRIEITANP